jgi:CheY-like chemotaxis protein
MTFKPYVPTPRSKPRVDTGRQSVLYVEDEDVNWELTANELQSKYNVTRAINSKEAFSILSRQKFDLVLMDIQLSGSDLNGIEITQILRGKFSGTTPAYAQNVRSISEPIVFVTAYSARYTREQLQEAGGDDMTTKPVNFASLSLLMSRLMMRGLQAR